MQTSRLAAIAALMLLSMGFVAYSEGPANAAKYCANPSLSHCS